MRILLVEDTQRLADALRAGLEGEGFEVTHVTQGRLALEQVAEAAFDALILDLGLPDCDGLEVLSGMQAQDYQAPVLVLTARDALASRVAALEAGADDYLIKPFAFEELLARLRALIRRARAPRWAPLACGDVELLADPRQMRVGEQIVRLSPRERGIMELLMRRQDEVVARADIYKQVFGYDFDPGTNVIDVHVAHLRKKLAGADPHIHTVRGVGFMLSTREVEA